VQGNVTITCNGIEPGEQFKNLTQLVQLINTALRGDSRKLDAILRELGEVRKTTTETNAQIMAVQQERQQAEVIRRTAPDINPFLRIRADGRLFVMIDCRNLVPFEFKSIITRPDGTLIHIEIPLEMSKVYPASGNTLFNQETSINVKEVAGGDIELRFDFKSLSSDELKLPGHRGRIVRKYRVSIDGSGLQPLP
jgi:hypothetical protein